MIDKLIIQETTSWPFVEARKLIKERKKIFEKKGKITLQTGYGPSGLPHIGTFGEVARTTMMVNAIKQFTDLPTEIITFSDDMDGLRKVPDNIPNKKVLEEKLGVENLLTAKKLMGIWKDRQKVASIGVGVSRFVTEHGLALNLEFDKKMFQEVQKISPCGMSSKIYKTIDSFDIDSKNLLEKFHNFYLESATTYFSRDI